MENIYIAYETYFFWTVFTWSAGSQVSGVLGVAPPSVQDY